MWAGGGCSVWGQRGQLCTKRVLISCKDRGHISKSCRERERATSAENEAHCISIWGLPERGGIGVGGG